MPWYRVVLSVIAPPVAVIDKGLGAIVVTTVLTFLGWVPGVVSALVYSSAPSRRKTV